MHRAIKPAIQYGILAHGIGMPTLHHLGHRTLSFGLPAHTGIIAVDSLGLSPYKLVLLGMSIGSAVKQDTWVSLLSGESTPVVPAIKIGLFNAFFNSVNSYAFLLSATSTSKEIDFPQPSLSWVRCCILSASLPSLWRRSNASASSQISRTKARLTWEACGSALVGAVFAIDFSTPVTPILNEYYGKGYGEAWKKLKQRTPYRLIPFVY